MFWFFNLILRLSDKSPKHPRFLNLPVSVPVLRLTLSRPTKTFLGPVVDLSVELSFPNVQFEYTEIPGHTDLSRPTPEIWSPRVSNRGRRRRSYSEPLNILYTKDPGWVWRISRHTRRSGETDSVELRLSPTKFSQVESGVPVPLVDLWNNDPPEPYFSRSHPGPSGVRSTRDPWYNTLFPGFPFGTGRCPTSK